ncbi:hypothetical protein MNV49_005536 [Pseudohyphozyma bogoriensis]|nr:hypothetical protein MNV49_005536 [Pseudohyphozyma bogoriensis]
MICPTLRLLSTRPIPVKHLSPEAVRLPPASSSSAASPSSSSSSSKSSSPTMDRLLTSLRTKHRQALRAAANTEAAVTGAAGLGGDGRGATNLNVAAAGEEGEVEAKVTEAKEGEEKLEDLLPPNLRFDEYVPKKVEYEGLQRLRREA